MKTSTILNAAADILETRGWTRGEYARDKDGCTISSSSCEATCFCAASAISRATHNLPDRGDLLRRAYEALEQAIAVQLDISGLISIAAWNDRKVRSSEEVIVTMRETALALEIAGD